MTKRLFLLLFSSGALCLGQTSATQMSGTVYDNSGAILAGASVTAVFDATGATLKQLTNSAGLWAFPSIAVGSYTVTVEMTGFKTAKRTNVVLVTDTPFVLNITLELGDTHDVVRVEASADVLNTSTATLSNVTERAAVSTLPLNGRNPLNLIVLDSGVTQRSGTGISVNGSRLQSSNVTIDGIEANEASNPTATNNVYRINPDNVEEFKSTTSNGTPEEGKNSGLNVNMVTKSGTNQFHGDVTYYFRNNDLNTNEFYANAQGQPRAILKSNQYGYDVGGPVWIPKVYNGRNRTFFYNSWQGQKVNLSQSIDKAFGSVPALYTPAALAGTYRYFVSNPAAPMTINGVKVTQNSPSLVTSSGALAPGVRNCASPTDSNCVQSYNMYGNDPQHIGADASVLKLLNSYPLPNDYNVGDGLNTAGYLWAAPSQVRGPRNIIRVDHIFNSNNNIFFRAMWAVEEQLKGDLLNGRPSIYPGFPPRGEVYRPAKNYALSWRTVLSPSLVNEATAGFARFTFYFTYGDSNPNFPNNIPAWTLNNATVDYIFSPHSIRTLNTPQLIDNLTWTKGAHVMKFGGNLRFYQQNDQSGSVGGVNVLPSISLASTLNPPGTAFNLPTIGSASAAGIASTDDARLLASINDLLGIPATIKQGFLGNLNTNTWDPLHSGNGLSLWYVGERAKQINFFGQDEWRIKRNLTMTYGLRWEWNKPSTEVSESPYVANLPLDGSQGPVTFQKAGSWYKRNNLDAFAPRLGIAWSPRNSQKTVVHAGYGIAFDSIPTYASAAAANTVPGLVYTCTATTYGVASTPGCGTVSSTARLATGFPESLPTPTVLPQSGLSPTAQLYGSAPNIVVFDQNLKVATVHQWNVTIQRELPWGFVISSGYVGNRGERLYSQTNSDQITATPAVLTSFGDMSSNYGKGCKPDGSGCPTGVTGIPVPYVTSGVLTSAFVNSSTSITDIQQNAAGDFAGRIEQTTLAAHLRANQQFSNIILLSNKADSIYHSWQTSIRKRFSQGLLLNFNYTYGKVIDDMSGDPVGTSYNPTTSTAIDSNNLRADRGRADFDQRRTAVLTWIYELPFGKGKPFMQTSNRFVQALFGGWQLQGFNSNQSGEPFSVTSGSKTFQYGANSRVALTGANAPSDSLVPGSLGPVFFTSTAGFQLAAAGSTGIGRNTFQGPSFWDMDGAISKNFPITERVKMNFRMEAFNALNHANFRSLAGTSVGSNSILSTSFGTACCQTQSVSTSTAIVSNGEAYRVVQFVLKLVF
jgi:Carboxypeptidase regulatory-like domain